MLVCDVAVQPWKGTTGLGLGPCQPGPLLSVESTAGVCARAWNVQHLAGLEIQPGAR